MFGIDFTFFWTALNLLVIYFFVDKFLFKKLGAHMDNRAASITADIEKGQALIAEGESLRSGQNELMAETREKQRELLDEARIKASKEYDNIINEARKEAALILQEAREESERERERLYKELQQDMTALVISAASKVIEANMDNEKNQELVERFLSKEGAA